MPENQKIIAKENKRLTKLLNKQKRLQQKPSPNYLDSYKLTRLENKIMLQRAYLDYLSQGTLHEAKTKKSLAREKQKRHQILHGNITSTIIMICFPLAIYGFFNSFYALLDTLMASLIKSNAEASGAINVSNVAIIAQVKSMLSAFGMGLAGGGAVLVSRYYGAGKIDDAKKAAGNMLLISTIISALILILFIPSAGLILRIAQVPEVSQNTILYFRLILVELIFLSFNSIFIGLEKVKGNSKKILWLNIIALMLKLMMNCIFIFLFNVDKIMYLEISTIIGQLFIFLIGVFILFSPKSLLQITLKTISPKKLYIIPILKLSVPIFLGKFVMSLGKAVVNALCGAYYNVATDGLIAGALGVSNNLSGLVTCTTNVFEEGESTIVAQNIGNKNLKRTIKAFTRSLILVAIISVVGFILVRFIFLDQLTDLFNTKNDERMPKYIKEIFFYDCLSIPALGLTSALLGLLYGYGKTFLSSILNFSRIGIRIITLVICHESGMNYQAAGVSMGISNVLIGVMALIFLIIFLVHLKKKGYKGMYINDPEPEYKELIL